MPSPTRAICVPSIAQLARSLLSPQFPPARGLDRIFDCIEAPCPPPMDDRT